MAMDDTPEVGLSCYALRAQKLALGLGQRSEPLIITVFDMLCRGILTHVCLSLILLR